MGLDRAPYEILTFIFSPLEVKPPNIGYIGMIMMYFVTSTRFPLLLNAVAGATIQSSLKVKGFFMFNLFDFISRCLDSGEMLMMKDTPGSVLLQTLWSDAGLLQSQSHRGVTST